MELSNEIYEELNTISPLLAGMEKRNVFSVPEDYFPAVALDLLKKVNATANHPNGFTVPEGYFDSLSNSILQKIRSEEDPQQELRTLSPMLYSVQNENVFQVPAGYFRNLENEIWGRIHPAAKVVEMRKRDSVWKYAAAAVVTGIIGLSSLMTFNSSKSTPDKATTQSVSSAIKSASEFKNDKQVNAAIATLSDDEIIKYLEKTGNDVDGEVLAAGIDGNVLPSTKDYLTDENTLETYLNQTGKDSQN